MIVPQRLANVPADHMAIYASGLPDDCPLSYGQLRHWAGRVAAGLKACGIKPGDTVMYQFPNDREFAVLTLALWHIRAVPCPLLPQLRQAELAAVSAETGAVCIIGWDQWHGCDYRALYADTFSRSERPQVLLLDHEQRTVPHHDFGGLAGSESFERIPEPDLPAQLLFTSGTTGAPKGVIHSHRSLASALATHARALELGPSDTVWVPSPLAHQTGFLYGMMLAWHLGAAAVYQSEWSASEGKQAVDRYEARFVQAALPFLRDLTLDVPHPPRSLRHFIVTGAPVPRTLAVQAAERLSCHVSGAWGSTECGLITASLPGDEPDKCWQTDGRPLPGASVRIVSEGGQDVEPETEGRLRVKAPYMFQTYLHHPEWRAQGLDEQGFFDTGDLAFMDRDGFLHLTGRVKDTINRGGEKIPVQVIENILYQHPGIRDVALIGIPDERLGERIGAAAVASPGADITLPCLTQFLKDHGIAKIYWPEHLWLVQDLPRTASGKIQKFLIRNQVLAQETQQGA